MNDATREFDAWYFDGQRPTAWPARVVVEPGALVIVADGNPPMRRERLATVQLSEPFRNAPRMVQLSGGATIEVPDSAAFTRALGMAGAPPALVARLQQSWPIAIVALAALAVLLVAAFTRGVPAAARWAAFALPDAVELRIGEQLLRLLDRRMLQQTRVNADRRAGIEARFAAAAAKVAPQVRYRLEFRYAGGGSDVNAFALPGGIIVIFDGLIMIADDDQVIAVLGHELGHIVQKHGTRNVFQAAGIGALAGLMWGDFAGASAHLPVALGVLRYSRDFERAADEFAVSFLAANGLSVEPLIRFFEIVAQKEGAQKGAIALPGFATTHPATVERIERLRKAAGGQTP